MGTPSGEKSPPRRSRSTTLAIITAIGTVIGGGGTTAYARYQSEVNRSVDTRLGALAAEQGTLREHDAAHGAMLEWLVRFHGGDPLRIASPADGGTPAPTVLLTPP